MDGFISKPIQLDELRDALLDVPAGPVSAEETAAAPIDHRQLETLRGLGKPELLAEVIGIFIESAAEELPQIHAAIDQGDAETVGDVAHHLKGSCLNVGAMVMGHLCEQIEDRAAEGELAGCLELLAAAEEAFDEARTLLEREIESGP
jgi:HPt (histidine-containing phosphotransfer) domain-containing protein